MFSVFDTALLPDEIHISKLSIWLSSQKVEELLFSYHVQNTALTYIFYNLSLQGAETSAITAKEASEEIRLEVEEALKTAMQVIATPSTVASSLEIVSFKPKGLFTYYDYQKCLEMIAEAGGSKGDKNMFGAYTEPCLVTVSTALAKWETNNLHFLSSSESLTKLVQLTYPSSKNVCDKLQNRSENLTRQISEHDRLTQSYDKKCRELCQQWGVSIDDHSSESSVDCNAAAEGVADALRRQLDTYASASYRKSIFESKVSGVGLYYAEKVAQIDYSPLDLYNYHSSVVKVVIAILVFNHTLVVPAEVVVAVEAVVVAV